MASPWRQDYLLRCCEMDSDLSWQEYKRYALHNWVSYNKECQPFFNSSAYRVRTHVEWKENILTWRAENIKYIHFGLLHEKCQSTLWDRRGTLESVQHFYADENSPMKFYGHVMRHLMMCAPEERIHEIPDQIPMHSYHSPGTSFPNVIGNNYIIETSDHVMHLVFNEPDMEPISYYTTVFPVSTSEVCLSGLITPLSSDEESSDTPGLENGHLDQSPQDNYDPTVPTGEGYPGYQLRHL